MRLLHSTTLEFHEFHTEDIPPYAILSHTWGDEEVSFKEMKKGGSESKKGYEKITFCAKQARSDGYDFFWIDTACINKKSSSELSEAINSMYKWYENAGVCYAYLIDVEGEFDKVTFQKSRWFTRGWTLQELIAPREVKFYGQEWGFLGSKREQLSGIIQLITGIQDEYLLGRFLGNATVATRMSWASNRSTTRTEDIAYSLLGIFGINMPLLYGEGDKAFIRLQEEIIKNSTDESIFMWTSPNTRILWDYNLRFDMNWPWTGKPDFADTSGILAPSPAYFRNSALIESGAPRSIVYNFWLTNNGMHMDLVLHPLDPMNDIYLGQFHTELTPKDGTTSCEWAVILRCVSYTKRKYERICPNILVYITDHDYYCHSNHRPKTDENQFVAPAILVHTPNRLHMIGKEMRKGQDPFTVSIQTVGNVTCSRVFNVSTGREDRPSGASTGGLIQTPHGRYVLSYTIPHGLKFIIVLQWTMSERCLFAVTTDSDAETPLCELREQISPSEWVEATFKGEIMKIFEVEQNPFQIKLWAQDYDATAHKIELVLKVKGSMRDDHREVPTDDPMRDNVWRVPTDDPMRDNVWGAPPDIPMRNNVWGASTDDPMRNSVWDAPTDDPMRDNAW